MHSEFREGTVITETFCSQDAGHFDELSAALGLRPSAIDNRPFSIMPSFSIHN